MPSVDVCHILLINVNWSLILNVELQVVVLLKMVVADIFSDDAHVEALIRILVPDTYNEVCIDIPPVFKSIASHVL